MNQAFLGEGLGKVPEYGLTSDSNRIMEKEIYRVVTREPDGSFLVRDFSDLEALKKIFQPLGIDNCSIHPDLRRCPIFEGLIGPLEDGPDIIRYETPEVFEVLAREWVKVVPVTRRKKKSEMHGKP